MTQHSIFIIFSYGAIVVKIIICIVVLLLTFCNCYSFRQELGLSFVSQLTIDRSVFADRIQRLNKG